MDHRSASRVHRSGSGAAVYALGRPALSRGRLDVRQARTGPAERALPMWAGMFTHTPAAFANGKITGLRHLVGGTPLLRLHCTHGGQSLEVYAKYEAMNFTGSIKDRMALYIIEEAYVRGELQPGDPIAEATSGNTGISFAAIGRALGHPVHIFMPDWMSRERIALLRSLGAEIEMVSAAEGGFRGAIAKSEAFAKINKRVFLPRQFENEANVRAHECATGPEILEQLSSVGMRPTAFTAGVGTGGTVMGVGRALRAAIANLPVQPLEPAESPTLRTGVKTGKHRIQGISDEFVPAIVSLSWLDAVVDVSDADAICMSRRLAAELGLGVGISSGANLLDALSLARRQGAESAVVTVFPDDNKKYLSTDLCCDAPPPPSALCDSVELVGFEVIGRGCGTCVERR